MDHSFYRNDCRHAWYTTDSYTHGKCIRCGEQLLYCLTKEDRASHKVEKPQQYDWTDWSKNRHQRRAEKSAKRRLG